MAKTQTKSVMQCVKEFIAQNTEFTTKQLREAYPNIDPNQLSTAVWKLTAQQKMLRKIGEGQYATVLTDVNKSEQPAEKAKPVAKKKKSASNSKIAQLKDQLENASKEILHWHKEAQNSKKLLHELRHADEQLQDALTLIRYLENKLVIAIQFNARNNGNT